MDQRRDEAERACARSGWHVSDHQLFVWLKPFWLKRTSDAKTLMQFEEIIIKSWQTTSPPRSYLTPSLVAGAGREHLPAATPKPQTMWK